jgi:hypothetical protein
VADEQTETPQDSTNSETSETETVETVETQAENASEGDGGTTFDVDDETTVLGAKAETEASEETSNAEGPPDTYELALKDDEGKDVVLDPEAVAAAEPVFRDLGLTNDQANKLMPVAKDFADRTTQAVYQQIIEGGAVQKKEWLDAFKADPEIGGAKAEETTHLAAKALDTMGFTLTGFGDDKKQPHPFRKALTESGFGNHPDMIRLTRKLGELVSEDGFVRADAGLTSKPDRLTTLYPDDVPK